MNKILLTSSLLFLCSLNCMANLLTPKEIEKKCLEHKKTGRIVIYQACIKREKGALNTKGCNLVNQTRISCPEGDYKVSSSIIRIISKIRSFIDSSNKFTQSKLNKCIRYRTEYITCENLSFKYIADKNKLKISASLENKKTLIDTSQNHIGSEYHGIAQ